MHPQSIPVRTPVQQGMTKLRSGDAQQLQHHLHSPCAALEKCKKIKKREAFASRLIGHAANY